MDVLAAAGSRIMTWSRDHSAVALTLAGLGIYSLLTLDYRLFYGPLDVAPEEIGVGYTETAAATAAATILVVVLGLSVATLLAASALVAATGIAAVLLIGYVAVYGSYLGLTTWILNLLWVRPQMALRARTIRRAGREDSSAVASLDEQIAKTQRLLARLHKARSRFDRAARGFYPGLLRGLADDLRSPLKRTALVTLIVLLLTATVLVYLPSQAVTLASQARLGVAVAPVTVLGFPLLDVRASPTQVFWIDLPRPPGLPFQDGDCLLSLGAADGVAVLFEASSGRVLRVPSSKVILRSQPSC